MSKETFEEWFNGEYGDDYLHHEEATWNHQQQKLEAKDARIKELETMTEGYRYRGVENRLLKIIESLTDKLEKLTECAFDKHIDGVRCSTWSCQGCKNKKLIEGEE